MGTLITTINENNHFICASIAKLAGAVEYIDTLMVRFQ